MKKQKSSNEITINHHPVNYYFYCLTASIIWGVVGIAVLASFESDVVQIVMIVLIIIGMMVMAYMYTKIEKRTITVEFNTDIIKIDSSRKQITIKLSDITHAEYYIYEEFNGYRDIVKRLELTLTVGKKDYCLNDRIEEKQIRSVKAGSNKTVPLMRLYGFIAAHCPDIVDGYKE